MLERGFYIGLKMVEAWPKPQLKEGAGVGQKAEEGYRVKYEDGYESWSPQETFELAYRKVSGITFSIALEACLRGAKIYRGGWHGVQNGIEMYVRQQLPDRHSKMTQPYLYLTVAFDYEEPDGATDHYVSRVPWLVSQSDLLAEDWVIQWPEETQSR